MCACWDEMETMFVSPQQIVPPIHRSQQLYLHAAIHTAHMKDAHQVLQPFCSVGEDLFLSIAQRRRRNNLKTPNGHLWSILFPSPPLAVISHQFRCFLVFPSQCWILPDHCWKEGPNVRIYAQHLAKIQSWCVKNNMELMKKYGICVIKVCLLIPALPMV